MSFKTPSFPGLSSRERARELHRYRLEHDAGYRAHLEITRLNNIERVAMNRQGLGPRAVCRRIKSANRERRPV